MADLQRFYANMAREAGDVRPVAGHRFDGHYDWAYGHDAQVFSHGLANVEFRVHLRPSAGAISDIDLARVQRRVQAGVDRYYNVGQRQTLTTRFGSQLSLHVEVVFIEDPGNAHLLVDLHPGNGRANLRHWFVDGHPATDAHEVTHGAFGIRDEYVDPTGLAPDRAMPNSAGVREDNSLMGDYWVGDAIRDNIADPRTRLHPRHAQEIGRAVLGPVADPTPVAPTARLGSEAKAEREYRTDHARSITRASGTSPRPPAPSERRQLHVGDERPGHVALAELRAISVLSATHPNTGRTSYVVDDAAAERMLTLLPLVGPDVRVRNYERGITVHANGTEWFFERKSLYQGDQASLQDLDHHDGADQSLGLPSSNASFVEFWGFRGVRHVNHEHLASLSLADRTAIQTILDEQPLLYYGHIGVSFDGGKTIYGFTPDLEAFLPQVMPETLKRMVKANEPVPGIVGDDTNVFTLARRYQTELGWDTEVTVAAQLVDVGAKAVAKDKTTTWRQDDGRAHDFDYQFPYKKPNEHGSHYAHACAANCATYPALLGLPVPEPSGILETYMPFLKHWRDDGPVERVLATEEP